MTGSAQMFRNLGLEPGVCADLYPALIAAFHPEDRADAEAALAEFRTRPGPMRLEPRVVWPSGKVRWLVFLGRALADERGAPIRMLGITIDSTRRRQAEDAAAAALRDSQRRLHE